MIEKRWLYLKEYSGFRYEDYGLFFFDFQECAGDLYYTNMYLKNEHGDQVTHVFFVDNTWIYSVWHHVKDVFVVYYNSKVPELSGLWHTVQRYDDP